MRPRGARWLAWLPLIALAGCAELQRRDPELAEILARREERIERALALPDSVVTDAPVLRWILPDALREISGMVLTADDRLFVHGDEQAMVHEIDYRRGVILKRFSLGSPPVRGDFEAIAIVRDTMLMLTSDGMLYRFTEGADSAAVPYSRIDTGLGGRCEFEGMTFDPVADALILACKNALDDAGDDAMLLYRWPMSTATPAPMLLTVPLAAVIGTREWTAFQPSDITFDSRSGNYLIVASRQKALAAITPAGAVMLSRSLPPGHPQTEGVAITSDNLLLVSDEATLGPAVLTAYRWHP